MKDYNGNSLAKCCKCGNTVFELNARQLGWEIKQVAGMGEHDWVCPTCVWFAEREALEASMEKTTCNGFTIKEKESFPAGANPFNHDMTRMGTSIGNNVVVMYASGSDQETKYLIVYHKPTGKRIRIDLPKE